jgi:hypothetical protein
MVGGSIAGPRDWIGALPSGSHPRPLAAHRLRRSVDRNLFSGLQLHPIVAIDMNEDQFGFRRSRPG